MLRKSLKTLLIFTLIGAVFFVLPPHLPTALATDTTFRVNVQEVLSVSISTPSTWASGDINTFLRNTVNLDVTSNNPEGFTASMLATNTNLKHSTKTNTTLPTLEENTTCSSAACTEFPANHWGYSLNDNFNTGTYSPIIDTSNSHTPISIISRADSQGTNGSPVTSKDVYFGSKANMNTTSGTYSGTVIFYIVSGAISEDSNNNPTVPDNPAEDVTGSTDPVYNQNSNRTVRTITNTTDGTTTTTTTISEGDARSSYSNPAGVTSSNTSNIYDGSMLTTALAVTASVAAASGVFFFVLAKRKKDDEEEEEEAK